MTRLTFVPLALIAAAVPVAALAQTTAAPQSVTRAQVTAKLDADYASLDADKDGKATRAEVEKRIVAETAAELALLSKRRDDSFKKLDTNGDGQISRAEFDAGVPLPKAPAADPAPVLARFDANKDGVITAAEYRAPTLSNFEKLDVNKDGTLTPAEQKAAPAGR